VAFRLLILQIMSIPPMHWRYRQISALSVLRYSLLINGNGRICCGLYSWNVRKLKYLKVISPVIFLRFFYTLIWKPLNSEFWLECRKAKVYARKTLILICSSYSRQMK
jgi:hypothetical protein